VASESRDSYAQAFVLLALGSLHSLTGYERLLSIADSTISFIEKSLIDPKHGGLFDASPVTGTSKRQNPHMHLFEAYLALAATAPRRNYLDRADTIAKLLERHLLDRSHGVLLEYFETDWSAHSDPVKGRIFEPGHHFEWIWLLRKYEALSGRSMDEFVDMLDESARSCGLNRLGLIYDEVLAGGSAHKRSSRVWPHTEAAKAAVAQHRKGVADGSHIVKYMTDALFAHFLDKPLEGTWIDHLDEDGRALVDFIPASSLYHLFVAGAEAAAIGHFEKPAVSSDARDI
jgi:mannose-6-phosphate isomerase